ncbi:hypothetical protein [Pseudobacillus wudalianchiensis]|uniref:Uncharacterized protein n=1 Tax=Pseudobacillus wudalianchiensis TaxID=1743143 RepID=A0A1B9AN22_9BACI|nr:hypothetical protein [Bacillus wudalianchiensis]OCA85260.1 hypothetical protein A8F95_11355 [Bacillus wudalianchiensis]
MIDRLSLGETAYFYHINTRLPDNFIKNLFITVSKRKSGPYAARVINAPYTISGKDISYSLCIFKYKGKPNFLEGEGNEEEIKYAYLLLLQYSNMLVINKKNISGFNSLLKNHISDVDYTTISRLFLNNNSTFEKISMLNMDINNNSIRKRNIEANDLQNSFSPIYSSKYIVNNMRIKENDNRISLAFNTSKINRLGKKVTIFDYFKWAVEIVDKVEAFELAESYLDNFSTPISTKSILGSLEPTSVLFLFNDLIDDIDNGLIEDTVYNFEGKEKKINLQKFLIKLDTFCKIEQDKINTKTYKIENLIDKNLKLKINKSSIIVNSKKLKNIIIKYQSKHITLLEYINKNQTFIVAFSEVEYVYSNKKLFKDSKLLENLDSFLEVLVPYDSLKKITSEKGNNYPTSSVSFDKQSLFFFIENTLALDVDYLFCDDLGNEFADFISIKNLQKICYYHAKYGESTLSASDFQIVIGQALKNIGNMNMSPSNLERKITRWHKNIPKTNIALKRVGDSVTAGGASLLKTLNSPSSIKEIFIVVNFLSKSQLENGLKNLKEGKSCPHQVVQILWLLSSFISTCKELGIIARITCLP